MKKSRILKVATLLLPLMLFSFWSFAQSISVQGVTKDESGSPIPGVTVVLKGTTQGTISDIDGAYTLKDVNSNGVLVFSFVGMKTQEQPINGQTVVNVVMLSDVEDLSEVVVVGYGVQRKEAVTGSVASMRGDDMRAIAASNVTQALQGRISGVEMTQSSSKPGSEMQIRIRGTRSLTASNDPLVVLDGIPFAGSIGDINPSDIKSVDILKDASATAIYGSRGANGVILITTNKGTKGQVAQVSYNGYAGLKTVFAQFPMMNSAELLKLREASKRIPAPGSDEDASVDTNWQDLMYDNAMVTSHDVAVNGGTDKSAYNMGAGYYKDESVLPGQNFERFTLRTSIDQEIGQYFRFGVTSNANYSVTNGSNLGIYGNLSASPMINPYNADGTLKEIVKMPSDDNYVLTRERIEGLGDKWVDQTKAFGSYNNLYGEVKIPGVEGLKYRANIGLNFRMANSGSYTGMGVFSATPSAVSSASISNRLTTNWVIENLVTYDRAFGKHLINAVALYSAEETRMNRSHVSALNIPSDHFQYYNLGRALDEITVNPNNQYYEVSALMSYMGRVMYSYDDRYMLTVAFRSDGSSRLAPGYKWHSYPAVSAGWNIRKENFMADVDFIDQLKVRAGYGQTSNQSVDPYKTLGLLGSRPYNFGDEFATGFYVSELPNEKLGWEYSETVNAGLDFGFLKSRLTGSFEYYVTNTRDLLMRVNLPGTAGVGSYLANVGKTQNKGWELSLNGVILDNKDGWTWEAGVNLYANRNELVELASGQTEDKANWWFVGHPIDVIFDYENVGLWNESDPDYKYLQTLEPGGTVGMIKVKYVGEYNEDGSPKRKIGEDDRQILSLEPKLQGGFNTRVAYKGFDLNVVGAFRSGGMLISTLHSSSGYLNMMSGRRNNVKVDYWTPENTDAKYPNPAGPISNDNPKYGSTMGYFNGSYLKVRALTLGYNFDSKGLLKDTGIDKLRLYATVQNPFVMFSPFHSETGMDPETNSYGDQNAAVTTTYQKRLLTIGTNTPTTRNYLFGINLTF